MKRLEWVFGAALGAALGAVLGAVLGLLLSGAPALAQFARQNPFSRGSQNPFSLGINEGAVGDVGRIGQWMLEQQALFHQALRQTAAAAAHDPTALLAFLGAAFAYGVFHAAGPGHGKAVIASYMLANEKALRRGVILSALAALVQALVAIALVAIAAWLLGATAKKMAEATQRVEIASYAGVAALGLWLLWRKAREFRLFWRASASRFRCDDGSQGESCPHCVAPDPRQFGAGFSWRHGAATVLAAGSRPCSGALLVLVFTLAQGAFSIGVWAVFAMAAGTGLTTAALAASAVLAKSVMAKVLGAQTRRSEIFARLFELAAASVVFFLGASLLAGALFSVSA